MAVYSGTEYFLRVKFPQILETDGSVLVACQFYELYGNGRFAMCCIYTVVR